MIPQIVIITHPSEWDVLVEPGDEAVHCKCSRCYSVYFFMGVGFYAAADKENLLCGKCCIDVWSEKLDVQACGAAAAKTERAMHSAMNSWQQKPSEAPVVPRVIKRSRLP